MTRSRYVDPDECPECGAPGTHRAGDCDVEQDEGDE